MRTEDQILDRIKEVRHDDIFGAERGDLIHALSFESAKNFLKDEYVEKVEAGEKTWEKESDPKKLIYDYLGFAWEKANHCRSLSASRSISHIRAWLWLCDDQEIYEKFESEDYQYYGKEKLIIASEYVGFDWRSVDNGSRTNTDQ